jgi:hypothetical protein
VLCLSVEFIQKSATDHLRHHAAPSALDLPLARSQISKYCFHISTKAACCSLLRFPTYPSGISLSFGVTSLMFDMFVAEKGDRSEEGEEMDLSLDEETV